MGPGRDGLVHQVVVGVRGKDDDTRGGQFFRHVPADLKTRAVRQPDVEQQDVGFRAQAFRHRLSYGPRLAHDLNRWRGQILQHGLDSAADEFAVVDDQDAQGGTGRRGHNERKETERYNA